MFYESHLWDSFLYAAADADFAGPAVTLRCPDILQYLTGHLYAKKSFALSHHFKATIYSSFCTKGCTSTLRLYVLNFVANECNLVVQFAIYSSGGKNGKNGSPVHR